MGFLKKNFTEYHEKFANTKKTTSLQIINTLISKTKLTEMMKQIVYADTDLWNKFVTLKQRFKLFDEVLFFAMKKRFH